MTVENGGGERRGTHLGWNLSLHASETRKGPKGTNVTVKKTILEGVTGSVRSGNMVALMGASGAGKSSLLDCISLRNQKFEGNVWVDGKPADDSFFGMTGKEGPGLDLMSGWAVGPIRTNERFM